jgi:predicted Rossmann fold nucleotide-binding protein DprA/Smf involved in DNA uptake
MTRRLIYREVLDAIHEGAVHAFDIFETTSLNIYETSTTLAHLERQGLISSAMDTPEGRARYWLTAAGRAELGGVDQCVTS